jgi:murein DD-endopeptidase MepM/ murein hydrolase activator NlpD
MSFDLRSLLFAWSVAALGFVVGTAAAAAQITASPTRAPEASVGIDGRWEGKLGPSALRLVLDITKTSDGLYFGALTSVDQGGSRIPIDRISVTDDSMQFEIRSLRVTYAGSMTPDKTRLVGTWTQGGRGRLEFTRATDTPPPEPKPTASSLFGVAATLSVPVEPQPFAANGKQHLAYELHVMNHSGVEMLLTRLEVVDEAATMARWEGAELHAIVAQRRANVADNRAIPAGGWAIIYVWVTIDSATRPPAMLRHRVTVGGRILEGAVPVVAARPIVVGPPLRGGDWTAANGPANTGGHHRRALVPIGGRAFIAQRFAIDWTKVGPTGQLFAGDQKDNRSYFGYGAEVIAVADAVVESVKDGIPENIPGGQQLRSADAGDTLRAVAMTLETVGGNFVILNLGGDRYAFYGHLMPGSLRVKAGDRVRRGDVIGLLGNSGNSTGPHLHFHISNAHTALAAEGLPYAIDSWEWMRVPNSWDRRTNEIPMLNARVRFR